MSITIFAAAAGTYVLDRERGAELARKIPVIGFQHVQGGVVFPLCAINVGGLTLGRALLTPDGFVTDPAFGVVCGDIDEWMVLTASKAYWAGPAERATTDTQAQAERPPEPADNTTRRIPDKPAGKPQEFINNTFWQHVGDHGDIDYIFVVEGGQPAPAKTAPDFKKIKRDEFQAEKRAGMTVISDWQTGVVEEAGSHLSGDPVDDIVEDEEDDGSSLI